jgi:hypothetical protein
MELKLNGLKKTGLTAALGALAVASAGQQVGQSRYLGGSFQDLQSSFRENRGQWDSEALFYTHEGGMSLWMTQNGVVIDVAKIREVLPLDEPDVNDDSNDAGSTPSKFERTGHSIGMTFLDGNKGVAQGRSETGIPMDYYVGPASSHAVGVKSYQEAYVRDIYAGVHLRGYKDELGLRYDIIAMPGSDPSLIRFRITGAESAYISPEGELIIDTSMGEIRSSKPYVYQPVGNRHNMIESSYKIEGDIVSFNLAPHDSRLPLIIDPLVYGTYFGGGTFDQIMGTTADSQGDLYMTGWTASADFPVTHGPYSWNLQGTFDTFLARIDSDAYRINYAAVLGGTGDEVGRDIGFNEATGDLWIAGLTDSTDLAGTTSGTPEGTFTGPTADFFLMKFTVGQDHEISPEFSRYFAEVGDTSISAPEPRTNAYSGTLYQSYEFGDMWADFEILSDGVAVLAGVADNADLLASGFAPNFPGAGGGVDGFIVKFDSTGAVSSRTLFGSTQDDLINRIDVGPEDSVAVAGFFSFGGNQDTSTETNPDFITTDGVYQNGRLIRNGDNFVIKFDSQMDTVFSALLGGSRTELAFGVALDTFGSVYVLGGTDSFDFPRTEGVMGENFSLNFQPALTKISSDGSEIEYSTALPFSGKVLPWDVDVDERGVVVIAGTVGFVHTGVDPSDTIPGSIGITADAIDGVYDGGDENVNFPNIPPNLTSFPSTVEGFVMFVNSTATNLVYSDYIGEEGDDVVTGVFVDPVGATWVIGSTTVAYAPIGIPKTPNGLGAYLTANALKISNNGGAEGFAIKLRVGLPIVDNVSFSPNAIAGGLGSSSNAIVTLREAAPVGGVTMTATLSNPAVSTFLAGGSQSTLTFTVPQGQTTVSLPVHTFAVNQQEFSTIRIVLDNDFVESRLSVNPWLDEFSIAPATVVGGNDLTARVRLFQNATSDVRVSLSVDREDLVDLPFSGEIVVPAGADNAAILLDTSGVDTPQNLTMTASLLGVAKEAPATVIPASLSAVIFNPDRVNGGEETEMRVVFNGKTGSARTVDLSHFDGEAGLLVDGNGLPTTVAIPEQTSEVALTATAPVVAQSTFATVQADEGSNFARGTLFIDDIDILEVQLSPSNDVVGGTLVTGVVTLTRAAGPNGFTIDLASDEPAAGQLSDSVLTVPAGSTTSPQFTLPTNIVAADVVTTISASKAGFTTAEVDLTVRAVSLTLDLDPTEVIGGFEDSVGTVTVDPAAPAGGYVVALASDDSAADVPDTVTVLEGETTATFDITTSLVNTQTIAQIDAVLSPDVNDSKDLTINPIEVDLEVTPGVVSGGDASNGKLTISVPAPVGGMVFTLNSDINEAATPNTVTIAEGETEANFTITTVTVGTQVTATITATSPSGLSASDTLVINALQVVSLSINPSFVTGGTDTTGTVTIERAAPASGIEVFLEADPAGAVSMPSSVVVPEGFTKVSFVITTSLVQVDTDVLVTASTDLATVNATLVILSPSVIGITFNPGEVTGGQGSTGTVTLDAPAPTGGLEITITAVNPDFATTTETTITVPAGERTASFAVTTSSVSRRVAAEFRASTTVNEVSGLLFVRP